MKLTNSSGSSVELTIVDYQFPKSTNDKYDANWLQIHIEATHTGRSWSATTPCLLTGEVEVLALWLEKVKSGQLTRQHLSFIEPVLVFSLVESKDGAKAVRLYFELDSRPEWATARSAGQEDLWIDFPLEEISFAESVGNLRFQLEKFPKRATHLPPPIRFPRV